MSILKNLVSWLGAGFITSIITCWLTAYFNEKNSLKKCRPYLKVKKLNNMLNAAQPNPGKLLVNNLSKFDAYNVEIIFEVHTEIASIVNQSYNGKQNYSIIKSDNSIELNVFDKINSIVNKKFKELSKEKQQMAYYGNGYIVDRVEIHMDSQEFERLIYIFTSDKNNNLIWKNKEKYRPKGSKPRRVVKWFSNMVS